MKDCPHRPPCPGCPRFGEDGIDRTALGRLQELARTAGLPGVEVVGGATSGFRLRARLAIRGRLGSPKIGLFEQGTHHVVHTPNCSVQHPLINRVAGVVRRALVDAQVTCYSDRAHLGIARYLQVVVERRTRSAQVVLVGNCDTPQPLEAALRLIQERLGDELHSLWFNSNRAPTNAILGPTFHKYCGAEAVVERFGGAAVYYPPGAFGQSNLEIAEAIIGHVRDLVPAGARVAEYYAGVGAIGLSLLAGLSRLSINEISPASLQGLELGLAELSPSERARIDVIRGAAGDAALAVTDAQVVIADPPRKGLDSALVDRLCAQPPDTFIYISCGVESFLQDCARLTASGDLQLVGLKAFNLLPYTEHVETVAQFQRRPDSNR